MIKVKLIFPCDFRVKEKENNKLLELGFKEKTCTTHTENTNSKIKAKMYSYISPLITINDSDEIMFDHEINDHKPIITNIFDFYLPTCENVLPEDYTIDEILYPYGIGLISKDLQYEKIKTIISDIEDGFRGFLINGNTDDSKLKWIVYDKPLILVECENDSELQLFADCSDVEDFSEKVKIDVANGSIFYIKEDSTKFIDAVVAIVIALKQTSSYIKVWSKGINYRKHKQQLIIEKIHASCAIFQEIRHSIIFRRKSEKKFFEKLYQALDIEALDQQVSSARELAESYAADIINDETQKINRTVFITGYISLIFGFLAFIPIQLENIFWIERKVSTLGKIAFSITSICLMMIFCATILSIYNKWHYILNDLSIISKKIKQILKWLKKKFLTCWVVLSIMLMIVAIIVFVVHICMGTFKFV